MGEPPFSDQTLLNLLHRAADLQAGLDSELLSPSELAQLEHLPAGDQQAQLAAWAAATALITRPPLPTSHAASLAAAVALAARLRQYPPAPTSLAAPLAADIALSAQLQSRPSLPASQARELASDIALSARLHTASPVSLPSSRAALLASQIASGATHAPHGLAAAAPERILSSPETRPSSRSAPLTLVGSLIAGLLLLTVSSAWPGLQAGAAALQDLTSRMPPSFGLGLALLLGTSLWLARSPQTPPPLSPASLPQATSSLRPLLSNPMLWGSVGFTTAALLTFPALYGLLDSQGVSLGQSLVIEGRHVGPVIALGGNIHLRPGSVVTGQVLTLLGDIRQDPGARVEGPVTALLGQGPGSTLSPHAGSESLSSLQLASATAIRPLLGWLGGAAWGALFWILTSTLTLALFISGAAKRLARRQRQAPLRTLALGVLALAALLLPATLLTFAGWLAPALGLCLLLVLLLALGLGVSAFDVGSQLACRLHSRMPDALGALIALGLLSATAAWPSLSLAVILVGGAWGSGSLLLIRQGQSGRHLT